MSYQEIVDAAETEFASLQAVDRAIGSRIRQIKDKEWNGPLTHQDREDLQQLREAKSALLATMEELNYVTIGALDKTQEVTRLANAIRATRQTLEGELNDIRNIEQIAEKIANILGGLTGVEDKLRGVLQDA